MKIISQKRNEFKVSSTKLKTFATFVIIAATSSSVTLPKTGFVLTVMPFSTGIDS